MGFFNTVKSFMTKDKEHNKQSQMQPGNGVGDNFNLEFVNQNDPNFIQQQGGNNGIVRNQWPQDQYFRPNEEYKQNQLNNTEMLYQNHNTIRPARMNLNNQYNYYTNNERQYIDEERELIAAPPIPASTLPGYVEPYYNHDAANNYSRPAQPQILPRRIYQSVPNSMQDQYLASQQSYGGYSHPEVMNYQNNRDGYFNDDHVYVNQYRRPYQRHVVNLYSQLQFNEQFNQSELSYDGKKYYPNVNPQTYFDGNQMMANSMPVPPNFYKNSIYLPTTKLEGQSWPNGFENNRYAYQPQSPTKRRRHFNREYANKLIPLEITREIRSEKVRTLIMITFGLFGAMSTSLFIALYFITHQQCLSSIMEIQAKYIPRPFLTITFLLISLGLLFAGIFDLSWVRIETNNYISHLMRGNHTIPHFLIDNYKKMTVRSIILNWLAFPTYFFGGIILGILYGFQQHAGEEFRFGFWSWGIVDDLTAAITITIAILIATLGIHIANIVLTKKRKANIIGYYGYEIVKPEELAALKKKTNRICLVVFIIFLIILTLVISIPWLIARRRKHRGEPIFGRWFNRN